MNSNIQHGIAGAFHGCVDFVTHQICSFNLIFCAIGSHEWEDPNERIFAQASFYTAQMEYVKNLDQWLIESLDIDPKHATYQNFRGMTTTALEVGILVVGGVGLARGGLKLAMRAGPSAVRGAEIAGGLALKEIQYAANAAAKQTATKAGRNRFVPHPDAIGEYTVFRSDLQTNRVTHYETFRPQANPCDPKPWESIVRFDHSNEKNYHFNKVTKERFYEPHMHDPNFIGGIRMADLWEIPK